MTDWAVVALVAFIVVGSTVLVEFVYSLGALVSFGVLVATVWLVVSIVRWCRNG